METQPLISVIIPVYNVANYLPRCLDSILTQTYKNLEIIVVDDGSTDNGLDICKEYAQKDKRITVIHQENKGLSAARNRGMEKMKGEFVTFVDSDDFLAPKALESFVQTALKTQTDVVWGDFIYVNEQNKRTYPLSSKAPELSLLSADDFFYYLLARKEGSVCGKLYRRNILDPVRFNENIRRTEDIPFWGVLAPHIQNAIFINQPLYGYYMRSDSICHTQADDIATLYKTLTLFENLYHDLAKQNFTRATKAAKAWWLHELNLQAATIILFDKENQFTTIYKQLHAQLAAHTRDLCTNPNIPVFSRLFGILFRFFPTGIRIVASVPLWKNKLRKLFVYRVAFYRPGR